MSSLSSFFTSRWRPGCHHQRGAQRRDAPVARPGEGGGDPDRCPLRAGRIARPGRDAPEGGAGGQARRRQPRQQRHGNPAAGGRDGADRPFLWGAAVVDTAQTAGVVPLDMQAMGIDLLIFTGHKGLLGPPGTGGLVLGDRVDPEGLDSLMQGGTGSYPEGTVRLAPGVFTTLEDVHAAVRAVEQVVRT